MIRVSTNPLEKEDVRQEQQQMATLNHAQDIKPENISEGKETEQQIKVTDNAPRYVTQFED